MATFLIADRERERGDNGLFIHWSPKFYKNDFLFIGLTTFDLIGAFNY